VTGYRGIDPLHPLLNEFDGIVADLKDWSRKRARVIGCYRSFCAAVELDSRAPRDPGPSMYVYAFTAGPWKSMRECVYVGQTRNPHARFQTHRKAHWWPRVTHAVVDRFDCRYHPDDPVCTAAELDGAGRALEAWYIRNLEPTENLSAV
jgi:hypothetical protein